MLSQVDGVITKTDGTTTAFLLVHGFCAAPDELATLGEFLKGLGISSFAVRLAGHGTTPDDLRKTSWTDWYNSVKQGYEVVKSWKTSHLFVVGFSMGGALSCVLAAEEDEIDGLVLIAPALKIGGILPKFVPLLKYFMRDRNVDIIKAQEIYDIKRTKYSKEPVSAYHELFKLQKYARRNLHSITRPTIIIQGTDDKTISTKNAALAFESIGSEQKELHLIEGGEHVIPCHWTRTEAYRLIREFIDKTVAYL